jgi:NAD(P)-dependent dehydrogenase (short-subunit alcohol dehydrogenase family)
VTKPGAILITGAGRGLGASLATRLAEIGYAIVALGRNESALNELIEGAGAAASITKVVGDARNSADLERAVYIAEGLPGGLYGIVANAGIAGPTERVHAITDDQWDESIETNLTGPFRLCRAALPAMIQHGHGRVVLIGSVTGKRPLPGRTPYAASKLGLVGLARTIALEVGRDGITVNVVSPWLLEGDRLDHVMQKQGELTGKSADETLAALTGGTVTGVTVSADDVAATVEFLLDERNKAITGQDINVSAGAVMY